MDLTERLSLPLIIAGQAQKELWHNEALSLLDTVVAAAVEEPPINDPPEAPSAGCCYIVGASPSGEWSEASSSLAAFTSAGWRFVAPTPGLIVLVKSSGTFATYGTGGWEVGTVRAAQVVVEDQQVVGARAGPIADPAGGSSVDAEARTAVTQILSALRQHGLISE